MIKRRANKLLIEPPSVATGDIAFNLIVFFLVCASTQPDSGRQQTIPKADQKEQKKEQKNIEVTLTRTTVSLNGDIVKMKDFGPRLRRLLAGKRRPEDKIVVVTSKPETDYKQWIAVTTQIEDAGGVVTLQIREEQAVEVP